jgi:hypothetical protein
VSWLYLKLDERLFRPAVNAFELVGIDDLIHDAASIEVQPDKRQCSEYFSEADINAILRYHLDVALYFGSRVLGGRALQIARHGVWSYSHADPMVHRGGPEGFWEVMQGQSLSGAVLRVLSADADGGRVLYRSWSSTVGRSVIENRNGVYWKSATFVLRKLRELAACRADTLTESDALPLRPFSHRPHRAPSNWEMTKLWVKLAARLVGHQLRKQVYLNQWFLAYHMATDAIGPAECLYQFREVFPPKDRFWADPFPVAAQGAFFIFLEEFPFATRKGYISVIEITASGDWKPPEKVLECDYHLSYPFVFSWRGQWYMIPETCQARRVELYESVEFPHRWKLRQTLLDDVMAVDSTLVERDGRWWMFTNIAPYGGSTMDELHVFFAESPLGPWVPHARNPVKSDVRCSRPAGRLFEYGGQLIRPAQDCSPGFGSATVLHRVDRLTPTEFAEQEVASILPQWRPGLRATHTYNWIPGITVIDGLLRRRKFF